MKVQKRFGSLLLAALLAVSLLGMPSARAAATDVALTAGETDSGVKLTVTAKTAFESVGGLSFSVEYNTDAFSLTSVSSPVDAEPSVNNETSTVTIFSETGVPVAAEAALAELNFTKKDGFLKGTEYPFTLRFSEAFDAAAEAYDWAQESYSAAYYEEPDMPENGTVNLSGISIRKTVETDSAYDPVTFSFTAESKSAPAGATPPSFGALSVTMQGTADSAQVSLPDEIWVDAPGTYEYTVRETAGSAGGWTYDSSAYVLQLEIDRNTDGFFLKEWHAVAPGGNMVNEIAFKNTYVAPQPAFTPPSVQFKVRQVINLGNSGLSSNDVIVRYTLKGVTANAPLPSTAKNDAFQVALRGTGTYQAPAITFSEPGTWKYDLTAVSNNADMSPQTIIITVTVEPTGEAKVSSALTNGTACEIQFTANAKAAATPTPTPTPRPTPSPTPTPKPGTVQTPTPTPRITPTPTPKNTSGNTPKTADTPRVFVFGLIALIATAILAVLAAWEIKDRRKKRN